MVKILTRYAFNHRIAYISGWAVTLSFVVVDGAESPYCTRFVIHTWINTNVVSACLVVRTVAVGVALSDGPRWLSWN